MWRYFIYKPAEMAKEFNLKWNDFEANASSSFKILREESEFFDVTLVSDDEHHISAHKLVLSASSEFFKNILRKSCHSNPLIYLTGMRFQDLEHILDYVYDGEVGVLQENLDGFMDIAQKLKIKGLMVKNEESNNPREHVYKSKEQVNAKNQINQEKILEPYTTLYTDNAAQEQQTSLPKTEAQDMIKNPKMHEKVENVENVLLKNGEVWECTLCGKQSQYKFNMRKHAEIHIGGDFSCNECGKSFKTSAIFNNHKYRNKCHSNPEQLPKYTCLANVTC